MTIEELTQLRNSLGDFKQEYYTNGQWSCRSYITDVEQMIFEKIELAQEEALQQLEQVARVERVAEALHTQTYPDWNWSDNSEVYKDTYRARARAILAVIDQPDQGQS
jgi:hypothetical protein